MNRICPSEEFLSEYLAGALLPEYKTAIERHLTGCTKCRQLLSEAHDIVNKTDVSEIKNKILRWIKTNRWFLGALMSLISSFLFQKYFLQFLVGSIIMGGKWITDLKSTKMLIMIHEAWKRGDKDEADNILSRFKMQK